MMAIRQAQLLLAAFCALLLTQLAPISVYAQTAAFATGPTNLRASLVAEGGAEPGKELMLALTFTPISNEWHGYWKNPGDAGYGMELDWDLPAGWAAGEPQYPAPHRLLLAGLMNHIYEGPYAVIVPVKIPDDAATGSVVKVAVDAQWLACTDKICVPEKARLTLAVTIGDGRTSDARFTQWRAEIPPLIDSMGTFQIAGDRLLVSVPLPAGLGISDPHLFIANRSLGTGVQPAYAAAQNFAYQGDQFAVSMPLKLLDLPDDFAKEEAPKQIEGILSLGEGQAIQFSAASGTVAADFAASGPGGAEAGKGDTPPLGWLLLAALVGGLLLNVMPCVFPILSLKALSLAKAGASEEQARREGIAYTVGVVSACTALGAIMLALRAAGEQVGWAFQLQEPWMVLALLVLAAIITVNFAGLFDLPSLTVTHKGQSASAFATGLLAAIAATPCTGPFMAAAMGASLLLPTGQALALFATLGLGLALPFLLIGFIPRLRALLPKPGPWMERFRRLMALPMALTALALVWLLSRLGGQGFALVTIILVAGLVIALAVVGKLQRAGKSAWPAFALIAAPFLIFAAFALPSAYSASGPSPSESLLDPVPFSEEALAKARQGGKPVFLWFTADWCFTCKVNEQAAIETGAARAAFKKSGAIAMRGDWTRRDAEITKFLTKNGVAGIPLYIWYIPGKKPKVLPQLLTKDILLEPLESGTTKTRGNDQSVSPDAGSD